MQNPPQTNAADSNLNLFELHKNLAHRIIQCTNYNLTRTDFLCQIPRIIIDFSKCDMVTLYIKEDGKLFYCSIREGSVDFNFVPFFENRNAQPEKEPEPGLSLAQICEEMLHGRSNFSLSDFTEGGSFWTGDIKKNPRLNMDFKKKNPMFPSPAINDNHKSVVLVPIGLGEENIGVLELGGKQENFFGENEVRLYEGIAEIIRIILINRRIQENLRERIKELKCLYDIATILAVPDKSLIDVMHDIVSIVPPAFLYPEIAAANISLDGKNYSSPGFQKGLQTLAADIVIEGEKRGGVEVAYTEQKPELDEGPFLREERNLINVIARQVAIIAEQKRAKESQMKLRDQLRHADRLATIGQLSAGIAHELNEPLSSVLGFAQLVKKSSKLPKQILSDMEKIETSALYAREVIRKLLIFARQMPSQKIPMNLNHVVDEGLYFFKNRCIKEGIKLSYLPCPGLPEIEGDPTQMKQVLVNLVVNAIQSMPKGGELTVQTASSKKHVSIFVMDTGCGMPEEVKKHIFTPFFTTKDVGEGTGLGLAVVYGIVKAHNGSVYFESEVGKGAWFEVRLPLKVQ
ncbi:MAG: hypothetical protein HY746_10495 [Elusimicrobia bacterium]|nr:hypothetical protein [Elusimicrobiota bacterium]